MRKQVKIEYKKIEAQAKDKTPKRLRQGTYYTKAQVKSRAGVNYTILN